MSISMHIGFKNYNKYFWLLDLKIIFISSMKQK